MKHVAITILCLLATISLHAQQEMDKQVEVFIQDITKTVMSRMPVHTVFSFGIVQGDSTYFYGFKKENETDVQPGDYSTSIFEIGSITKVFTAILFAQLLEESKISRTNTLADFMPIADKHGAKITLEQLANHSSGLPRVPHGLIKASPLNPFKDFSEQALLAFANNEIKIADTATARYQYSNVGYGLLGYILTKVMQTSYDNLVQTSITKPLGMLSTDVRTVDSSKLIDGRDTAGKVTPRWDLNAMIPAGGLTSTAQDMTRFMRAIMEGRLPQAAVTLEPTLEVAPGLTMGLGWHSVQLPNNRIWYFHNGGTFGYTASMVMDMELKIGVILLTNLSAYHDMFPMVDKTAHNLMRKLSS